MQVQSTACTACYAGKYKNPYKPDENMPGLPVDCGTALPNRF